MQVQTSIKEKVEEDQLNKIEDALDYNQIAMQKLTSTSSLQYFPASPMSNILLLPSSSGKPTYIILSILPGRVKAYE